MMSIRRKEIGRSRLALLNLTGVVGQKIIAAVVGLIIPKLLIETFGSAVNGTVISAANFLAIISLLSGGFDSVAKTAFYKPLARKDNVELSKVFNASDAFFKKIALMFGVYCVALALVFPTLTENGNDYFFTFSLVLILGIDSFASEYFGITYIVLLNADQRSSIYSVINSFCTVLNAIVVFACIKVGFGIHAVKLMSTAVFLMKPIFVNYVGKKYYNINRKIKGDDTLIAEKWSNMGVTISGFVQSKVDYVMMTLFLPITEVSVYGLYQLVISTLQGFISALSTGFVPGMGNMYANSEMEVFKKTFSLYEFVNFFITTFLFTVAALTITPFVSLYTMNVGDAVYNRPIFGYLIVLAQTVNCLCLPYFYAIVNARHFSQMTKPAVYEVIINVVLSVLLVFPLGIIGLAIGTLISSLYKLIYYVWYCSIKISHIKICYFIKRILVFGISGIMTVFVSILWPHQISSYMSWIKFSVVISLVILFFEGVLSFIFFRTDTNNLYIKIKSAMFRGEEIK